MINLKNTTFIIPVGIESEDRAVNTEITISYLCKHLETNIIIYEFSKESKVPQIIGNINKGNTSIEHVYERADTDIFHRTRFLNIMTMMAKTPIVVNYDVDILLDPETYKKSSEEILNGADLIYPYFWGDSQKRIFYPGRDKIRKNLDLTTLIDGEFDLCRSEYGHCQFFKRDSYIRGGLENENFISYAPEDQERGYRFKTLGYNVKWLDGFVYHIQHTRGPNSSNNNPMFSHNHRIFDYIKSLSKDKLIEYYKSASYLKKYNIK